MGMKRHICTVFLVLAGAAAVFGGEFSLSAGAGGIVGGFFTRYTLKADGMIANIPMKIDATQEMDQFNYGCFAFFDATYGIFSVFFQNGVNTFKQTQDIYGVPSADPTTGNGWDQVLGLSLLGKYPFRLNDHFTVFPLLGIEYQIALKQIRIHPYDKQKTYDRWDGVWEYHKKGEAFLLEDWNAFWVDLGGGVDLTLPKRFFLRGERLYSFRLQTSYETKNLEYMIDMSGDNNPTKGGLTSGPSIRLSAGYRFYTKQ
jgi:opacity protein-like surface antigen